VKETEKQKQAEESRGPTEWTRTTKTKKMKKEKTMLPLVPDEYCCD